MTKDGDFHGIVAFTLILTILASFLILSSSQLTGMTVADSKSGSFLTTKSEYYSFSAHTISILSLIFITAILLSGYFHLSEHINFLDKKEDTSNSLITKEEDSNINASRFVYNSNLNQQNHREQKSEIANPSLHNNYTQKLTPYYSIHLNKGFSVSEISNHLINFGWDKSIINKIEEDFKKETTEIKNIPAFNNYSQIKGYVYNSIKNKQPINIIEKELSDQNIPLNLIHDLINQSIADIKKEEYKLKTKKETRKHRYNFRF
jgi:hypothetical protein